MIILITGLSGSGKTTFACSLIDGMMKSKKSFIWLNGDNIRKMYDDWDFSDAGRLRQAKRMAEKATICNELGLVVICDFICPTEQLRKVFNADITVWMDTVKESQYKDTDRIFEAPNYTIRITDFSEFDENISLLCGTA